MSVEVLIHADNVDPGAWDQISILAQHPAFEGLMAIMPDTHKGSGCVIGFTGRFKDAVIPNIVGVDINCGVIAYRLPKKDIDYSQLDAFIRDSIPLGSSSHSDTTLKRLKAVSDQNTWKHTLELCEHMKTDFLEKIFFEESRKKTPITDPLYQIGTLGGGNHFIEVEVSSDGTLYLLIHSGSRNFGYKVAEHFQRKAKEFCKENSIYVATDTEYLPLNAEGNAYKYWMQQAQKYARLNRMSMLQGILSHLNEDYDPDNLINSEHNFISEEDGIIRKGAIAAYTGQKVVIPLNMSEGTVLGVGKSNPRFNFSGPHGAGRVSGRKEMKRKLAAGEVTMEDFTSSMEGIFTTSVSEDTIDESKFAYKTFADIETHLKETVDVVEILKPVYNLKAS
jgi:tRNA-splicing ligase RtcB